MLYWYESARYPGFGIAIGGVYPAMYLCIPFRFMYIILALSQFCTNALRIYIDDVVASA
jgi:hypothetical protein